jgi:bacteriocin-like protein
MTDPKQDAPKPPSPASKEEPSKKRELDDTDLAQISGGGGSAPVPFKQKLKL